MSTHIRPVKKLNMRNPWSKIIKNQYSIYLSRCWKVAANIHMYISAYVYVYLILVQKVFAQILLNGTICKSPCKICSLCKPNNMTMNNFLNATLKFVSLVIYLLFRDFSCVVCFKFSSFMLFFFLLTNIFSWNYARGYYEYPMHTDL